MFCIDSIFKKWLQSKKEIQKCLSPITNHQSPITNHQSPSAKANVMQFKKAFTLVEILIVVAVIALLAAITIPNIFRAIKHAQYIKVIANIRRLAEAVDVYQGQTGSFPMDLTSLTSPNPPYVSNKLAALCVNGMSGFISDQWLYQCNFFSPGAYAYYFAADDQTDGAVYSSGNFYRCSLNMGVWTGPGGEFNGWRFCEGYQNGVMVYYDSPSGTNVIKPF